MASTAVEAMAQANLGNKQEMSVPAAPAPKLSYAEKVSEATKDKDKSQTAPLVNDVKELPSKMDEGRPTESQPAANAAEADKNPAKESKLLKKDSKDSEICEKSTHADTNTKSDPKTKTAEPKTFVEAPLPKTNPWNKSSIQNAVEAPPAGSSQFSCFAFPILYCL